MRTRSRRVAAAVMMLGVLAGCQGNWPPGERGATGRATVSHVVLCWLKDPGNEEDRRKMIEASKTFRDIPGVVSVDVGTAILSTRPVVDSTYDVAVVIRFTDEAALRAYDEHPVHKRAVADVLRPLARRLVIYDFSHR